MPGRLYFLGLILLYTKDQQSRAITNMPTDLKTQAKDLLRNLHTMQPG